jgi:outer membrane autotransporter protein
VDKDSVRPTLARFKRPLRVLTHAAPAALLLALAPVATQAVELDFTFSGGGSGYVTFDTSLADSINLALADASNFEAKFEIDDQVWTQDDAAAKYPPLVGLTSTYALRDASGGAGQDWYWDDGSNGVGDTSIVTFDNGETVLAFDEGDLGSRVYRIDDIVMGTYTATGNPTGSPSQPSVRTIDDALDDIAFSTNTQSTARVIGNACPAANEQTPNAQFTDDCNVLVGAALIPNNTLNDEASFALGAVTVEQAAVPLSSSRASLSSQRQNLSTRLSALRSGVTGLSVRGLAFEVDGQTVPGLAGMGVDGVGGAASADENPLFAGGGRLGAFINGTVSSFDKDATSNEEGFDGDSWSLTGGLDYRFRDNLIGGLAVGYYSSNNDVDNNGGSLDADGYSLSLYGTYYHGDSFYVDGIVTYGSNDYDQRRNIRYQIGGVNVSQSATADYNGDQWSAAVNAGYMLSNGAWSYGPALRLEYVSAHVDGYAERISNPNANGGGWATRLDDLDQESLTSTLGFDVSRAFSASWGVITPQLYLGWTHEYRNSPISVNGSFIQDPTGSVFGITGDDPDPDYFNGRIGASAQFPGGGTAFLYYNKVFGYRDLDVDTVGAGVRLTF